MRANESCFANWEWRNSRYEPLGAPAFLLARLRGTCHISHSVRSGNAPAGMPALPGANNVSCATSGTEQLFPLASCDGLFGENLKLSILESVSRFARAPLELEPGAALR